MKGKILFVAGLGLGYVLGTRAGREKYEELKSAALKVWNDPRVQKQVDAAQEFVKDKAPEVAEFVSDTAKTVTGTAKSVVDKVAGKPAPKSSAAKKPAGGSRSTSSAS